MAASENRRSFWPQDRRGYATLAGLLVLAACIRLFGISDRVLWYDELQSVVHAIQPVPQLLASVSEYDPHPPLHYLQLHFWLAFGTDEVWLRLNSVLWSLSAIPPVYFTGRRLYGARGGFWAALVFALSPLAVFFAQEVRMYAMEMSLVAFNLFFFERLLTGSKRHLDVLFFFLTLVLALYAQGVGFILLLSVGAYGLLRLGSAAFEPQFNWFPRTVAAATLCVIPWFLEAHGTTLNHLRTSSLLEIPDVLLKFMLGPGAGGFPPVFQVLTAVAALGALAALLASPPTRTLAIAYLLLPFTLLLALAYLVTPLWHHNALASYLPPLSVLAAGAIVTLQDRAGRYSWLCTAAAAAVLLFVFLPHALAVNADTAFRRMHYDAAQYLAGEVEPGAEIEVGNRRDFWAISWYLASPGAVPPIKDDNPVALSEQRQVSWAGEERDSDATGWRVVREAGDETVAKRFGWLQVVKPD